MSNRKCLARIDGNVLLCVILSLLVAIIIFFPTHSFGAARSESYSYNESRSNNDQLDIQREIAGKDLV
ncbi:MAG TPA: hypothetical protein VD694_05630, partial [Nitrososphaeraceae archaeon]|nr:hypothetical protein [Nitrososphaeraceae archaeon]